MILIFNGSWMMTQAHILKVSRLEGLTDGVFAIAMTILMFDLRLPPGTLETNLFTLLHTQVLLKLCIYIGSFTILGTLWVAMNFQLGLLERVNRPYLWANVFYLMIVCIVPFSASLVAAFPNSPASISFFAINLLFASMGQLITSLSASKQQLNRDSYSTEIHQAILQRIFIAPIFYIASLVVAHWSTPIAFVLLVIPPIIYLFPGKVDHYDQ